MNNLKKIGLYFGGVVAIILVASIAINTSSVVSILKNFGRATFGSFGPDSYMSTTTSASFCGLAGNFKLLKTGGGTLGSVVITNESAAGAFNLYDATTTALAGEDIYATTTLAVIANSTAEGTYTYDSAFTRGLIVEVANSQLCAATSTITWK